MKEKKRVVTNSVTINATHKSTTAELFSIALEGIIATFFLLWRLFTWIFRGIISLSKWIYSKFDKKSNSKDNKK